MITKLDGTPVDITELRTQLNRKIKSTCVGHDGETFADLVIQSIAARQAKDAPVRPCDLQWDLATAKGMRRPPVHRRVDAWDYLVQVGIADTRNRYLTHDDSVLMRCSD